MATRYECDRCGKSSQLIVDFDVVELRDDGGQWDLCNDCIRSLREWIEQGKGNIKGARR